MAVSLPTLYEYYTEGGVAQGLSANQSYFTLNERNITLYSGGMHYFRTPKQLWRDRLRKMRSAGLNAVETYVPWNLHEPQPGVYDFGEGGTDMEYFLNLPEFLKIAREEDLLAIVRPGPYICAEWEFGGFPSWLLQENDIKFRTSDEKYMKHVRRFFNVLLPILAALQFVNGGPIVAFQVENEYGSTKSSTFTPDKEYLMELRQLFLDNKITELLFTSDGVTSFRDAGTLPEFFLLTANFDGDPDEPFKVLQEIQPDRPKMVMEYYPGWFDHWGENHHTTSPLAFIVNLEAVLIYPGSFNLYMMHGGTSYGFMNGANLGNAEIDNSGYQPDTTSYDYDALLTESGEYTKKYDLLKDLLGLYANPKTKLPDPPLLSPKIAYANITVTNNIPLSNLIDTQTLHVTNITMLPMELLPINNYTGQSYGYIVYRKHLDLQAGSILKIVGHVSDTVLVLLNGKLISPKLNSTDDLKHFGFWKANNASLELPSEDIKNATLDLVVENWGRVGYGNLKQYYQFKGLLSGIEINNKVVTDWIHIPMEFRKSWNIKLSQWSDNNDYSGPGIYKGILTVENGQIRDTYVDMREWKKGIVIVNGFVLGRYARIGPQQCLYLPSPFIKEGENDILIFEHYQASSFITFSENQIYETI